ncbi:hypothetical protein FQA39_LY13918 [Lamprigera yunnana]|nr:hypothetical protein FQA39_LY13918 [Lamprigera yunnana]
MAFFSFPNKEKNLKVYQGAVPSLFVYNGTDKNEAPERATSFLRKKKRQEIVNLAIAATNRQSLVDTPFENVDSPQEYVESGIGIQCEIGQENLRSILNESIPEGTSQILDSTFDPYDFSESDPNDESKIEDCDVEDTIKFKRPVYIIYFECLKALFSLLRCSHCGSFQFEKTTVKVIYY